MVKLVDDDPSLLKYIDHQILAHLPNHLPSTRLSKSLPFITVTWAQSLNGALCDHEGNPMEISCPSSMTMTHVLRGRHDAILVGIGTILADNPRLTARLAHSSEPIHQPQPVVLDTHLQMPLQAKLWLHPKSPWIITECTQEDKIMHLTALGAKVFSVPNMRDLASIATLLYQHRIRSLMVEGGYRILQAFLQAHLLDTCIVTVAPMHVATTRKLDTAFPKKKTRVRWHVLDKDAIMVLEVVE